MSSITEMQAERADLIARSKSIVRNVTEQGRENLNSEEYREVNEAVERVKLLDRQMKGRATVQSVIGLTNAEEDAALHGGDSYGFKSRVFTAEAARGLVDAFKTRANYRTEVPAKAALTGGALLPTSRAPVSCPACTRTGSLLASVFANERRPGSPPV